MHANEFALVDVLRLRPLDGHRLWVRFSDDSEGVRDLSSEIAKGGVMAEPLKSKQYFDRVSSKWVADVAERFRHRAGLAVPRDGIGGRVDASKLMRRYRILTTAAFTAAAVICARLASAALAFKREIVP